jgi:LAS superfamily LD-carboxypeptidase LdcB
MIHSKVKPFLESMILKARSENIDLFVLSSYRSFDDQAVLKKGYTVTYGKGTANQFSADQGYSEHQLGTTIDFTTNSLKGNLVGFDKTSSYKWLQENAHLFGFTLSYPKGNEYYIFEPWHFRFVGVELATKLKNENKYFYDLDHQLGTTIDFTTNSLKGNLVGFDKTSSYKWLQENAHLFGFTLSYPKGNEYYIFEPWHFRFVGVELATKLKNENKYFYDLDQREISQYLVKIFD